MRELESLVLDASDSVATRAVGFALSRSIAGIDASVVISLQGELGAGKTTLVGGFLHGFGYGGHARSPTYTLIEPYELEGRSIYHLDLYRLIDPREVEALGLRDLLQPRCVFLIEWPDKGAGMLPNFDIAISIQYGPTGGRRIIVQSCSESCSVAIQKLRV